jgi:alanyl-tRNA synthetase
VASGVRRIEAVTGEETLDALYGAEARLSEIGAALKVGDAGEILTRLEQQTAELRELRRWAEAARAKAANDLAGELLENASDVGGLKYAEYVRRVASDEPDADAMRKLGDTLREREPKIVAVFASVTSDKATFFTFCGKNAVSAGVKAGDLVRRVSKIAGGAGGGKPESAMGGGRDPSKLDDALRDAREFVKEVATNG